MNGYRERKHDPRPWLIYSQKLLADDDEDPSFPGPWDDEPDESLWTDPDTNYLCRATRNHLGHWCGYVAVPREHPYHGASAEFLYEQKIEISVHGGLTFSDTFFEEGDWWFGFDCGHAWDLGPIDLIFARMGMDFLNERKVYRDLNYVKLQCTYLAKQLHDLAIAYHKRGRRELVLDENTLSALLDLRGEE